MAYEIHRKLESDKEIERFKYLTLKRNVARGDVLTLNRLATEKSEELDRMNQRLEKRYPVDQIIPKLREADVDLGKGKKVPEICKKLGVTVQTYYRWRQPSIPD